MVASPTTRAPLASIPCSAGPSQTNESVNFEPPYTMVAYSVAPIPLQGSGVPHGLILDDVYNDLLKCAPVSSVRTIVPTDPITHRLASNAQTPTRRNYDANVA